MNLEGTPTAPLTVQCADCRRWIARGTTCQRCWPGNHDPVPEGEHNRADAPPSDIDESEPDTVGPDPIPHLSANGFGWCDGCRKRRAVRQLPNGQWWCKRCRQG